MRVTVYWYSTEAATSLCMEYVCNKYIGIKMLSWKHHSFKIQLYGSGRAGWLHSQVCHRYGKQAPHTSQLKSSMLKRTKTAAATTGKMELETTFSQRCIRNQKSMLRMQAWCLSMSYWWLTQGHLSWTRPVLSPTKTYLLESLGDCTMYYMDTCTAIAVSEHVVVAHSWHQSGKMGNCLPSWGRGGEVLSLISGENSWVKKGTEHCFNPCI